ncbi:MAG: malonic semialdehyde reductase [Hyphomicrobiaceae bacterium]|nr:malonic semialdehyde reductase [Hyphomicrobiaceae bacterium]
MTAPTAPLPAASLNQLFFDARTHNAWQDREVPDALLRELVDVAKWAPTSVNMSPMRLVFVKSKAAKAKLEPMVMESNRAKTMAAPVTAIVAYDLRFYDHLPKLFPAYDAKSWFTGNDEFARVSAIRNGTLQGGYLILAARALGLDCGPMSGFDNAGVDAAFFAGSEVKSNFLLNLGYGDPAGLHHRSPRFAFDDMAQIV